MSLIRVFVDSDVIISSLISTSGAARFLLFGKRKLSLFISNISKEELETVATNLKINQQKLKNLIKTKFKVVRLGKKPETLKQKYKEYTTDPNDAHIVVGAVKSKANFLISYNIRHFKIDKIKQDFKILVLTPANFLQYLRSKNFF